MITITIIISHGHHLCHLSICTSIDENLFLISNRKIYHNRTEDSTVFVIFRNDWFWGFVEVSFQQIFLFPFQQNGTRWPRNACFNKRKKQDLYLYFQAYCRKKTHLQQFLFVFVRHLLQEKKQFVFQFGCKLVRGVGWGWGKLLSCPPPRRTRKRDKIIDFKDNIVVINFIIIIIIIIV